MAFSNKKIYGIVSVGLLLTGGLVASFLDHSTHYSVSRAIISLLGPGATTWLAGLAAWQTALLSLSIVVVLGGFVLGFISFFIKNKRKADDQRIKINRIPSTKTTIKKASHSQQDNTREKKVELAEKEYKIAYEQLKSKLKFVGSIYEHIAAFQSKQEFENKTDSFNQCVRKIADIRSDLASFKTDITTQYSMLIINEDQQNLLSELEELVTKVNKAIETFEEQYEEWYKAFDEARKSAGYKIPENSTKNEPSNP